MDAFSEAWVNDYLDLYNYARSIGDSAWEAEILEALRNRNDLMEYRRTIMLRELWRTYETINRQLMEVFANLREEANRHRTEALRDRWFHLKLMRIDVARKIMSYK